MATLSQRSFAGGELSPSLHSRVDTQKYQQGAKTMRNFMVLSDGGTSNRSGTEYLLPVVDETKKVRLIPFVFNVEQTYVLEFGHFYVRVLKAGVPVATVVTPYEESQLSKIQYTQSADVLTLTHKSHAPRELQRLSDSNWELSEISFVTTTGPEAIATKSASGSNTYRYVITAIDDETKQESLPSAKEKSKSIVSAVSILSDSITIQVLNHGLSTNDSVYVFIKFFGMTQQTATALEGYFVVGYVSDANSFNISKPGVLSGAQNWSTGSIYRDYCTASGASAPSLGSPVTLTIDLQSSASEYNVYKEQNGVFGFIGSAQKLKNTSASTISFKDVGQDVQTTENPPSDRLIWGVGDYPACVGIYQQRRLFASTSADVEKVYGTQTGNYKNFSVRSPIQNDDSLLFRLGGQQVNEVRHLLPLEKLLVLTSSSEWEITGDTAGILTPTDINPKQVSSYGASYLSPLVVGASALFVQARGANIRSLAFEYESDGYRGNDMTAFSRHLFKDREIVSWAYQQTPHSIVWAVRDDGVLLGLTWIKEQEIWGWHRHDFDGSVEQVCSVPEGQEDALYLVIKRIINGQTRRFIERLSSRRFLNLKRAKFSDCSKSFDGTNYDSTLTMTLSGGTTWAFSETLTLTASAQFFSSADVGQEIHISQGSELLRFKIEGYQSPSVVTGKPSKTVPVSMRNVGLSSWSKAIKTVTGLSHIEGKAVSVLADGYVAASPNNPDFPVLSVTSGAITLENAASIIHVGLPIVSDLETLDIDTSQGETLVTRKKFISDVSLRVEDSRGIFIGPKEPTGANLVEGMIEYEPLDFTTSDDLPLLGGNIDLVLASEWNSNGRVFIRQIDPLPLTILSISPTGLIPVRS